MIIQLPRQPRMWTLRSLWILRGNLRLSIADNGIGMDRDGLIKRNEITDPLERPPPSSLGKFGLGLKTASTAFCRSSDGKIFRYQKPAV